MDNVTGVILAGGKNSRMATQNKALLSVDGERIIDRIVANFRRMFRDIIIVTNTPSEYYDIDAKIVTDIYTAGCPLAGIHSALFHANTEWIFAVPCDLPFLSTEMIRLITGGIAPQFSVVIPQTTAGYEPLCAAYSKKNLSRIEANLEAGDYKLLNFFKKKQVRIVTENQLRKVDPELRSFFNVNTPEELETAESFAANGEK